MNTFHVHVRNYAHKKSPCSHEKVLCTRQLLHAHKSFIPHPVGRNGRIFHPNAILSNDFNKVCQAHKIFLQEHQKVREEIPLCSCVYGGHEIVSNVIFFFPCPLKAGVSKHFFKKGNIQKNEGKTDSLRYNHFYCNNVR